MRKISYVFFALFLTLLMVSSVSAFSITADSDSASICIGSTKMLSSLVEGSGSFTVVQEGTASPFSTTVPTSFSTDSSQNIYSYITPSSKVSPGDYNLKVKVSDGSEQKEQEYSLTVKDCQKTEFTVDDKKATCPCQKTEFVLKIVNNADYSENYTLSADGTLKGWINFSEQSFSIPSGEEKEVIASVDAPCNINGQYDITFKLKPSKYFSSMTAKSEMDIGSCYDYSMEFGSSEYSSCENAQSIAPLTISNKGTSDNLFSITMEGPDWITYEKNISVSAGQSTIVNFSMNPPQGSVGDFILKIEASSSQGNINKKAETKMTVENCYGTFIRFENDKETVCNENKEYSYPVTVQNSGKADETLNLSLEGPSWATLSTNTLSVKSNESQQVYVNVEFPSDLEAEEYSIKVIASGATQSEDTLTIEARYSEDCFSSQITPEKSSMEVLLEGSNTIPVEVKNDGLMESTFMIGLDGEASSFSMINPEIITLGAGESQTLYLYVSPPSYAELREYTLSVNSRVKDTNFVSSEEITINVVNELSVVESNETVKEGFFSRMLSKIKSFFSGLFSSNVSEEQETSENFTVENVAVEEISNETIVSEVESPTEAVVEEIENVSEEAVLEPVAEVSEEVLDETVELNETSEVVENITLSDEALSNETIIENETVEATVEPVVETKQGFSFRSYFNKLFGAKETQTLNETLSNETVEIANETVEEVIAETSEVVENVTVEPVNETSEIVSNETVKTPGLFSRLFARLFGATSDAVANAPNETVEIINETSEVVENATLSEETVVSENVESNESLSNETIEPVAEKPGFFARLFGFGKTEETSNETVEEVSNESIELNETSEVIEPVTEVIENITLSNETAIANETVKQPGFFSRLFSRLFKSNDALSNETVIFNETVISNETVEVVQPVTEVTEEIVSNETIISENVESNESVSDETQDLTENLEDLESSDVNITKFNWENTKKSLLNFSAYKDYFIGMVSLILLIVIFATGFWKKIINFFDDENAAPNTVKNK